ncbi:glycosyltransferase [Iningainema tapete]|uniref:Glycosyltransferase n=1 Tax=Iningainema tapete BLCC-T55 TaxID=2748662 RepID=A0A8J6XAU2_9CYAN|nr:glycosyltransferase [Iningainema tapete]MBD2771530.1 glycosyltransferase [Iningainema tapete BLCC-T55]
MPNVSVIIPTYKRANLVSQAIESVLAQTYTDYEIIVVNDGSPDRTKEVLAKFEHKIIAIHQENQGVSAARNTGIKAAAGKYIAFLDDDDMWLANKLEKQIACLESNPKIGLVYSDMFYFNEDGVLPNTWGQANPTPPVQECWLLFVRNFIPTPSVVVRRECLEQVGLFDETLATCEDYDLWLRIIEKWSVHFLNEPLVYYRRSSTNSLQSNEERQLICWLLVKEKAFHRNVGLQKLPLMVLDQCFFNGYLSLAYSYIERYQGEKARLALDRYQQYRGVNSTSKWLRMISFPALNPSLTDDLVKV